MTITELKAEYNKYLEAYYKGEKVLDAREYKKEDEKRYLDRFDFILHQLNKLLETITIYKQENILGGF